MAHLERPETRAQLKRQRQAKGRAKKIIEAAQAEASRIKANAHQPARNPGPCANPTIVLNLNAEDDTNAAKDTNEACPIVFLNLNADEDDTNDRPSDRTETPR